MKIFTILIMTLTFLSLTGCATVNYEEMNSLWKIKPRQVASQFENLEGGKRYREFPSSYSLANLATIYDAEMFVLFTRNIEDKCYLNKRKIVDDQIRWLKRRDTEVRTIHEQSGGSLASVLAAKKKIEMTKNRISELKSKFTTE